MHTELIRNWAISYCTFAAGVKCQTIQYHGGYISKCNTHQSFTYNSMGGVGGDVLARLLSILREGEAGLCRTCCVRSGFDVVGGVARACDGKD